MLPTRGKIPPRVSLYREAANEFVPLKIKKPRSPIDDYRYLIIALLTGIIILLCKAGGLRFREAIVLGLWIGSIIWVLWQVVRHFTQKSGPAKAGKAAKQVPKVTPGTLAPHGTKFQKPNLNQPKGRR